MGTRSTTRIYEDGRLLLALYKQYDGYPDEWGQQLKDFIHSGVFVNGITRGKNKPQFNGVGDFVLQLVKHFKEDAGGLYATTEKNRAEYNYMIEFDYDKDDYSRLKYSISCMEDDQFFEAGWIDVDNCFSNN